MGLLPQEVLEMAHFIAYLLHPFAHAHAGTSGVVLDRPVVGQRERSTTTKHVTPKWVDVILIIVLVLVALLTTFAYVPMIWGLYPVMGHSMEPAFTFVGGYFQAEVAKDIRINDIVVLDGKTIGYSVKRVAKIDAQKGVYTLGDNTDCSMDSSFGANSNDNTRETWIPFAEVRGKVTDIWSPARAWRHYSPTGQFQNWVEFTYAPRLVNWSPTGDYVVVCREDKDVADVYHHTSRVPVLSISGRFKMWLDEKSFVAVSGTVVSRVTLPDGTTKPWAITPTMLGMGFQQSSVVTIDGPADVTAGDTIEFRSHPEIRGRVKNVSRESKGGMWGLVTVVKLDPSLPFQPQFGEGIKIRHTYHGR